jgi:arylsulfatase A-like enzyme
VKTPAIDALAADGVVFERAYSHAPQTLPAHASLLSGRLPFETGVRDNVGFAVKSSERMLPQMLRDRGFTTGGVVSAYVLRKETGISQGFDFFDGEMPATADTTCQSRQVQRRRLRNPKRLPNTGSRRSAPRAVSVPASYEPHKPYAPPARFAEYAPYDGEIAYADEIVGRLVEVSEDAPALRPFDRDPVADHGEGLGDHG